jgi:hypothetical protein
MTVLRLLTGLLLLTSQTVFGAAQNSPLDAAANLVSADMNGSWTNMDSKARGLVRVVITGTSVHPYGACHPTACDWGTLHAQGFASKVDRQDQAALLANSDTGFSRTVLTITVEADGRLRVQTFTHFTDHSGRADYTMIDYFVRQ